MLLIQADQSVLMQLPLALKQYLLVDTLRDTVDSYQQKVNILLQYQHYIIIKKYIIYLALLAKTLEFLTKMTKIT